MTAAVLRIAEAVRRLLAPGGVIAASRVLVILSTNDEAEFASRTDPSTSRACSENDNPRPLGSGICCRGFSPWGQLAKPNVQAAFRMGSVRQRRAIPRWVGALVVQTTSRRKMKTPRNSRFR